MSRNAARTANTGRSATSRATDEATAGEATAGEATAHINAAAHQGAAARINAAARQGAGAPAATGTASKIAAAFKSGKALVAFATGGDPSVQQSSEYFLSMIEAGADVIEIGIPFSDPIAEGPVIQEASLRALRADVDIDTLFTLVASLRKRMAPQVPILFMGYLNPLLHYGYDRFFARCAQVQADGVIIADLPYEERTELREAARKHDITVISMIAPTSAERVALIAREAEGFIYLVSSLGVTGERAEIHTNLKTMVEQIRMVSKTPIAVGFGVHTPKQARALTVQADGVQADGIIVGSAIVRRIAASPHTAAQDLVHYVREMKAAMELEEPEV
jgi:tryptophan synthase alpha chain